MIEDLYPYLRRYWDLTEKTIETLVFACRWLLAPFYVGLALSLVVLLIKFMEELWHLGMHAFTSTESQVILGVLSLVDMALTGSLLIIVIFSGYENFVSRIDLSGHKDWPQWMGTIDFSALKLKLLSSIVAISAIQLLKQFMAIKEVTDRDLMWLIGIHVVFVISSVLLALADRIAGHNAPGHGAHAMAVPAPHAPDHDAPATQAPPAPNVPHSPDVPRARDPVPHENIQIATAELPATNHGAAKVPAGEPAAQPAAKSPPESKPQPPGPRDKGKGPR